MSDDGEITRVEAMVPLRRYDGVCKRQFARDEEYPLAPIEARSMKSHNHYFSALHEGFNNLPEGETRWPSTEHFRKWALVQEGYCDEKHIVCDTPRLAREMAAIIRSYSDYAVITVKGNVVNVFDAKSQSVSAMGKDEFEASKKAVLDRLASMTGTSRTQLMKEGGRSA